MSLPEASASSFEAHGSATHRVLVVDDDPTLRDLLCKRLDFDGFRCDARGSGEEGLAAYLKAHCDGDPFAILLIDIGLGATSGRDLLSMIRAGDERTTIVMISARENFPTAIECLSIGADAYLGKPIKFWDMRNRLSTAMLKRRTIFEREPAIESFGIAFGILTQESARQSGPDQTQAESTADSGVERASSPAQQIGHARQRQAGLQLGGAAGAGSMRPISPPGALMHIASSLDQKHGKLEMIESITRRVVKLAAHLAVPLELTPVDLEAVCIAARVEDLSLAQAGSSAWDPVFASRFVRAVAAVTNVGTMKHAVELAADTLGACAIPSLDPGSAKRLASLLIAARESLTHESIAAPDLDRDTYELARRALEKL